MRIRFMNRITRERYRYIDPLFYTPDYFVCVTIDGKQKYVATKNIMRA